MMKRFKTFGLAALCTAGLAFAGAATAQEGGAHETMTPAKQSWSFAGPFGHYDQAQLQRGFMVFRTVCANCHGANLLAFRNLTDAGGPGFSEGQVKALAEEYTVTDGPGDDGKPFERKARPADYWPATYPNAEAAKATLGAAPPDMSVLAKARSYERGLPGALSDLFTQYQEHGVDYIYSLVALGYTDAKDPNHNDYFPGGHIAMAKPLSDGQVEYTDGSPKTVQQYARDVAAFLMWTAEPKLEDRKKTGFRVIIFLILFSSLLYYTKKKIWADAH
jgi:ubiquinol-cytochrome c reductase cytochrome c1 subunit